MSDVTYHFDHVTFIFCIILDILNDVWKFLFLFLITLTIPLLSPRNYSFTTFLTSEKIKEILNQWIKVIFSDSVMSHKKSGPEIRQIASIQGFQFLKSLETV